MVNLLDEEYRSNLDLTTQFGPQVRAGLTFGGAAQTYLEETYSNISDRVRFGAPQGDWDPDLNVFEELPERLQFMAAEFADARNKDDLMRRVMAYDASQQRMADMARTSGWKMFAAGAIVDPINLVPVAGVSSNFMRSAALAGSLGFGVGVAQEMASSENISRTAGERALNVGANTVIFSVLGGVSSIPIAARSRAIQTALNDFKDIDTIFPARTANTVMSGKPPAALPPEVANQLPKAAQPLYGPAVPELPVSNFYIDSKFDRFMTTPMKRTLARDVPSDVQTVMYDIGSSHDLISMANQSGQTRGASVFIESQRMNGEWTSTYRSIRDGWAKRRGGSTRVGEADLSDLRIRGSRLVDRAFGRKRQTEQTIEEFAEEMGYKYMAGIDGADDIERQVIGEIKKFFSNYEVRLRESGLIGEPRFWRMRIDQLNDSLNNKFRPERNSVEAQFNAATGKKKTILKKELRKLDGAIRQIEAKVRSFENQLEASKQLEVKPQKKENHFPRFWRQDALGSNASLRKELEDVLTGWFQSKNRVIKRNKDGDYEVEILSGKPSDARDRAKDAIREILNENYQDVDNLTYGAGQSMNLRHRKIDIPNELVAKFIETNPIKVMQAYTQRVAPAYSFFKKFGGRSIDELELENTISMRRAGLSVERINQVNADIRMMYERVLGKVLRSPDRWDFKTYNAVQALMRMTYLGSTALTSMTEVMRLVMDNGMPKTMRAIAGYYSNSRIKMSAREAQISGQALEGILGSAIFRVSENLSSNPLAKDLFDKTQDAFFAMTGLNFVTRTLKELDVVLRQHKFIEFALMDAAGTLDEKSLSILRKHGLSKSDSKGIAKLVRDGVIEQDTKTGFYLANTEAWPDSKVRDNFRNSLSIGIMNTILMATPSDKPIVVDGVVFIPSRIAEGFGFKPDPNYSGYSRIESPLLAAPFGLMSYTLAATNKALGSASQGQHKHLLSGVLFGMGVSWMLLDYKTPDYIWNEMPLQDKVARAFDLTGMGGIWMDLVYRSLSMGEASGFGNPTGGFLSPRFPPEKGVASVAQEIMGPSSSWLYDTGEAIGDLFEGKMSEGASDLIRQMPGSTLFYWRHLVNEWRRGLEDALPEQVGFGRF